jgi:ATP-dependent helicase HrpB
MLLQPRRVAARAIASRIAAERGWTLGREVGWQIRFERKFAADTRLLVVTEGILTARLQSDPLLSGFHTIILDEFHERSVHGDVAVALARQDWRARDDLRIVVMSATLDAGAVSSFLGGCPVIEVPGRMHPIDVAYAPGQSVAEAASDLIRTADGRVGDILCFLPGAAEIRRAIADIEHQLSGHVVDVIALHGSLDGRDQDLALMPSARQRIIVATNIAETSLTVPGVTAVIDTGLHKVARYDADRGIDSLETERITADSADQRAGRAGRESPGVVRRLWDARDRLRPHREPEIHRIDLSATILDVIAWGGDPRTLEWFERPHEEALDAGLALLTRLGLIVADPPTEITPGPSGPGSPALRVRLTAIGEQVQRLPLHPRLARMLLAASGAREVARACALLSERHLLQARTASTSSDLLSAIDEWRTVPPHVHRVASEIDSIASGVSGFSRARHPIDDVQFRRAVLAGYPDRVAKRREPGSPNVLLASGAGAVVAPESGVHDGEFLVALDVHARAGAGLRGSGVRTFRSASAPASTDALIRIASIVDRGWLQPTGSEVVHRFDKVTGSVKAVRVDRYDALVLAEHPAPIDPDAAALLLADAWTHRGPRDGDVRLQRRVRFAGLTMDLDDVVRSAARLARTLDDVQLERGLPADVMRELDRSAPDTMPVPSGRQVRLEYEEDGTVSASVKLQEVFGLAETPRIGRRREPVRLALLAPSGRPVQVTRDLRSFWDSTYPEVRKELRGRYPKHPWPEDPWTAPPTARTKRKV